MFVAAFLLGPLFALLSSAIRIRADAFNFVSQFRRPDIVHAKDIGAWFRILKLITKVSILVNAFVLAFTSEFIPKLLCRVKYSSESSSGGTLTGYISNSLSSITRLTYFETNPERNQKTLLLNCHTMTQSAGFSKIFLKICFKFFYFTYFNSKVIIAGVSFVYRLYTGLKSRTATIIYFLRT